MAPSWARTDQAFPRQLAEEAQAILWPDTGGDPRDPKKPDFMDWRANIMSKGRALLMLQMFSDVGRVGRA